MKNDLDRILESLKSKERPANSVDKELWDAWKAELAAVANRMPHFKTMRYQSLQSIAKEKLEEIQLLKANKTT